MLPIGSYFVGSKSGFNKKGQGLVPKPNPARVLGSSSNT